ncbi:MAG TPA: hypothetical protein VH186_13135 [Chloroflexia bacterium]|nr:hypothetical protein [Chloroflexia bacterium]
MFRLAQRIALALVMLSSLLVNLQPAHAAGPTIYENGRNNQKLSTDGQSLVWLSYDTADTKFQNGDIYLRDPQGQVHLVTSGPGHRYSPQVSGKYVVWLESGAKDTIRALDWTSGKEFTVAEAQEKQLYGVTVLERFEQVQLVGTVVYWSTFLVDRVHKDIGGTTEIKSLDLAHPENTASQFYYTDQTGANFIKFTISGDWIVWMSEFAASGSQCVLFKHKLNDLTAENINIVDKASSAACMIGWAGSGNTILYNVNPTAGMTTYDLQSDKEQDIYPEVRFEDGNRDTYLSDYQQPIFTDGRYFFYRRYSYLDEGVRECNVEAYDLASGSAFNISLGCGEDSKYNFTNVPVLKNGQLYWLQSTGENVTALQSAPLAEFLPTAPRPQKAQPGYYFKETGHTLSGTFKAYWDKNGGLPVFGFPTTEEFSEVEFSTGKAFTVQYFERARFEYHPENKDTPYEVLLGLLGQKELQNRGVNLPDSYRVGQQDSNCIFFKEVNRSTCGSFYRYWKSHGLDLGDPGTSIREALALFGYPVSEPFTDPQTGFVTQYFERARFEYHPENRGTPYEVLLGRLAISSLVERGWL